MSDTGAKPQPAKITLDMIVQDIKNWFLERYQKRLRTGFADVSEMQAEEGVYYRKSVLKTAVEQLVQECFLRKGLVKSKYHSDASVYGFFYSPTKNA